MELVLAENSRSAPPTPFPMRHVATIHSFKCSPLESEIICILGSGLDHGIQTCVFLTVCSI
jgi:hypothetical protein